MVPPADVEQNYRFWAFISYSSKDAATAKKLHRALETYSIPRDLRGRPGRDGEIPYKLFPIFRDRDELPLAADLGSTITDALRASRYLIVLCSPNAAKSHWVDEEIRTFKAMGREDRILAIILDGEPNAAGVPGKEALECFPPSLKVRVGRDGVLTSEPTEPIGGDLRKGGDGWNVAFLKAVAGITGLGFNAFARREQKRKRVRRALTGVALLALAAAGVWRWDYTRVKVHRYECFVLCHGVPRGLGEVDDDRFSKRYMTYQIEESRRKVRRLSAVNRFGTPGIFSMVDASYVDGVEFGFTRQASSLAVKYREDGTVAAHDLYDSTGREILRHVYSADQKVVELRNPGRDTAQTMAADSASVSRRGSGSALGAQNSGNGQTEIARWRVKLDANGYVVEKTYGNAWGDPTADRDGKAVVRYTRDEKGRLTGESALGLDGQPVEEVGSTVVSSRQEYNEQGRLCLYRFMDLDGRLTIGPLGYAVEEIRYDPAGNVTERRFLDKQAGPVMRMDGFAVFHANYDKRGILLSKTFYDTEGKPVVVPGFGYYELRIEHDDLGREIANAAFNTAGEPVLMPEGYHRFEWVLDAKGRAVRSSLFGVSGEPVLHPKEFWHRREWKFDSRGNMVESVSSGTDGKPTADNDGVCRKTWTFDDADRATGIRCYGADGEPCLDKNGVHETHCTYDARGNITRWAYFGIDRKPVLQSEGYHVMKQLYDERGNLVETAFFGTREEPVVDRTGRVHRSTFGYNARGQYIETRLFDVAARPTHDPKEGYHLTRYEYDPAGNLTGEAWFDAEDHPVNRRSDGTHRYERKVDPHGRVLSEAFFNEEGKKVLSSDGYHKLVQEFDDRGNEVTEAYFGVNDEPVNRLALGIHKIIREYNDRGQETSERYIDASGAASPMKGVSYSKLVQTFDGHGNVASKSYLDGDGKAVIFSDAGYAMQKMVYDERGNLTETSYFGLDLLPMDLVQGGYHKSVSRYDGMGNEIETTYFDSEGEPIVCASGFHRYAARYDSRGHLMERSFFGINGEPMLSDNLVAHRVTQVCDERGNVLEQAFFDTEGKPSLGADGIHRTTQKFDAMGNVVESRTYGTDGKPVVSEGFGAHLTKWRYDGFGQVTEVCWMGAGGEPVDVSLGYHKCLTAYDSSGNAVANSYFDHDGKPAIEEETGVHMIRRRFNSKNQLIQISYEDAAGKPVLGSNGYARETIGYDLRGNMSEIQYYGAEGECVLYNGGTRWLQSYDPVTNAPLKVYIYDLEGNLVEQ